MRGHLFIMKMSYQKIPFGLKEKKLIHISEVSSGASCECTCPCCGEHLIARKGEIKIHHFAHKSNAVCEGVFETAIHLLAKEILIEHKELYTPVFEKEDFIKEGVLVKFDNIVLEKTIKINDETIIPDAIGVLNGKEVLIEFAKTHFVDKAKKEKIKKLGLPCIEIDLSGVECKKEVIIELLRNKLGNEKKPQKYWINNPHFDKLYESHLRIKEQTRKEQINLQLLKNSWYMQFSLRYKKSDLPPISKWREDKFGHKLYSRTLERIWLYGEKLIECGFSQNKNKPYLFQLKIARGSIFFANFGGTREVPIYKDQSALLHWIFQDEVPEWMQENIVNKIAEHIKKNGVECRSSFYDRVLYKPL